MRLLDMIVGHGWLSGLLLGAVLSLVFMVAAGRSREGRRVFESVGFQRRLDASPLGLLLSFIAFFLFAVLVALVLQAHGWVSGLDKGWWQGIGFLVVMVLSFVMMWGHYTGRRWRHILMLWVLRVIPIMIIALALTF
ncbi:MAG: hypothetical protein GDA50_07130 [Alphaproteobacteria bacterium GM202ARS2]|nr:hypothetical protein [Alphaproteobacteria bacterium GM202ARS2]